MSAARLFANFFSHYDFLYRTDKTHSSSTELIRHLGDFYSSQYCCCQGKVHCIEAAVGYYKDNERRVRLKKFNFSMEQIILPPKCS